MTLQLRFSNSGLRLARYPSSVVQTGVKSLGWENRIAQPFPIHSWNVMVPWVVSAVKFGASSLMRSDMALPRAAVLWVVDVGHPRGIRGQGRIILTGPISGRPRGLRS